MKQYLEDIAEALRAPGVVLFVAAAAGMGKSTVIQAVLSSMPHLRCTVISCLPGQSDEAALHNIANLVAEGQTILIEDAHWLDQACQAALLRLIAHMPGTCRIVVTYRPDELTVAGLPLGAEPRAAVGIRIAAVELRPMSIEELTAFAQPAFDVEVPAPVLAPLGQLSGGVAALAAHCVQAAASGQGDPVGAMECAGLPAAYVQWLHSRLTRMPAAQQSVLYAAAVAVEVTDVVLAQVAEVSAAEFDDAVTVLVRSGLLVTSPGTKIAAELVRRWLYQQIAPMRRAHLHASAMKALSIHEPADRAALARHSGLSGDWAAASRFGEEAAEQAMLAGDTAAALGLLEQLVAQAPAGSPARVRLAVKLARLAPLSVHREETFVLLRDLVRDERLPAGIRGEIRLDFGLLLMNQMGHGEDGWKEITRAVSELRRRPALAARGMAALVVPHWGSCHVDEHRWWAEQAKQTVARARHPAIATAVVANELSLLMNVGDPSIWERVPQLADHEGSVAQRQQAGRAYCNLADAAVWLGHSQHAARFLREGLRLAVDAGAAYAVGLGNGTQLRLEFSLGRWADLGRRALRLLGEPAGWPVIADARLVLAQLALSRGEWAEALGLLEVPGMREPHIGCAPQLCAASAVRITSFAATNQPGLAGQELAIALDRLRTKGIWGWASDLLHAAVPFLIGQGLAAEAGQLVDEVAQQIAGQDTPLAEATVRYCRGALCESAGELSEAIRWYELAAAEYQAIDRPYDQARAGEAAGRCRLACGEHAEDQLRAVAGRYATLGASWDASRCGHLLRRYGAVAPRPRRGRHGYGSSLTPREQQVARLMALGRTNREIAEVLFLSPRTVELHAARVLRKMAVSDRAELPGLPEPE